MARKRVINIRHPELTDEQWELLACVLPEPQPSIRYAFFRTFEKAVLGLESVVGDATLPRPEKESKGSGVDFKR